MITSFSRSFVFYESKNAKIWNIGSIAIDVSFEPFLVSNEV